MSQNFVTAAASGDSVQAVASALAQSLPQDAAAILYFSSVEYDPVALAPAIAKTFPNSQTFGCTAAGEFVTGQAHEHSVVAIAMGREVLSNLCVQTIDLSDPATSIAAAFAAFAQHFGEPVSAMNPDNYLGLVFFDGLSGMEERAMEELGSGNDLRFVGGSAGDDLKFQKTFVFADGEAHSNRAVVALARCAMPYRVIKTQSFVPLAPELTATKISGREVLEFNGKPARQAYEEALTAAGISFKDPTECFMEYPLGLVLDIGDSQDIYIRSPQRVADDGQGLVFYCAITDGITFNLMKGGDIVSDTAAAMAAATQGMKVEGLLNFNCILRSLGLKAHDQLEAYGKVFQMPSIGFATYGEAYLGHINQTSVMVVFGKD